jgi:uncharacterized protein GlcG (DUF336 family)
VLDFDRARLIADAVLAEGEKRNAGPLTVAVLDAGGHVVVLYRATGAGIVRPQIATGKAWGALGLGFSSRGIAGAAERFPAFFDALAVASEGRVVPAPGGVLLRDGDRLLGAVGVSGASSDVDESCGIVAAYEAGLIPSHRHRRSDLVYTAFAPGCADGQGSSRGAGNQGRSSVTSSGLIASAMRRHTVLNCFT